MCLVPPESSQLAPTASLASDPIPFSQWTVLAHVHLGNNNCSLLFSVNCPFPISNLQRPIYYALQYSQRRTTSPIVQFVLAGRTRVLGEFKEPFSVVLSSRSRPRTLRASAAHLH